MYEDQTSELERSAAAVSQWVTRAREGGPHALRYRAPSSAPRRLAAAHLARLPDLLHRGAEAYGFRGQVWTWLARTSGLRS